MQLKTYPFWCGWGWGKLVLAILSQACCSCSIRETLLDVCVEPLAEHVDVDLVDVDLKLLLELVQVLLLLAASPHGGAWTSDFGSRMPPSTT